MKSTKGYLRSKKLTNARSQHCSAVSTSTEWCPPTTLELKFPTLSVFECDLFVGLGSVRRVRESLE